MVPPTLRPVPENQLSAESTSSDESNTSSRDGSGNVSPDTETKEQSSTAPHPLVRMLLETSGSVNESGYDTNPSDSENSLPNSAEVNRKQYVSPHGVPSIVYESLQLPVEGVETHETLC